MKILQAIILGLAQGLTEFLPVSSSGHLIIFKHLFAMDTETFGLFFDIAVHFATLAAVFVVFRKDIWELLKKPFQKYVLLLIIATIPAAVVGFCFDGFIERISASGGFLGISFLITAIVLFFADRIGKKYKASEDIGYKDAAVIGLAQAAAVIPGISRSGSALSAGLFMGLKKETAIKFAFLMSIPVILGAGALGVKDVIKAPESVNITVVLVGMLAAGISGYCAIKFMLDFFKKRSLLGFAIYVAVLGALILIDQLFFKRFFEVFLL